MSFINNLNLQKKNVIVKAEVEGEDELVPFLME
jgi:hypothetical protein